MTNENMKFWESVKKTDPKRVNSHKLKDVTTRFGVVVTRPHDALADALGTALVLPHLLRAHNITTVEQLTAHFGA